MTISTVVQDTTQEYDETLTPAAQPLQIYQAHVVDPLYNIGIYINCGTVRNYRGSATLAYYFITGIAVDGIVMNSMPTAYYTFEAGLHTITKQSFGSMVKYIFPLNSASQSNSSMSGSAYYDTRVVGHFVTLSGFKAANLLTGGEETFATFGVANNNYWFIITPYSTANQLICDTATGHVSGLPQPNGERTLLWQSPLYCSGQLYNKINSGRLFSCSGSSNSLPVGADFTVDGVTLRALDTKYALELT